MANGIGRNLDYELQRRAAKRLRRSYRLVRAIGCYERSRVVGPVACVLVFNLNADREVH